MAATTMDLNALIAKLDRTCKTALEAAAGVCLNRTQYHVDIEHVFSKLLDDANSDTQRILSHFGANVSRLEKDLQAAMDGFRTGSSRGPTLSQNLIRLLEKAWLFASLNFNAGNIRSGHLVLAMMGDPELARVIEKSSSQFACIVLEELEKRFDDIVSGSDEVKQGVLVDRGTAASPSATARGNERESALARFTVDLTANARDGRIDPVLGRDAEIRQLVDILTRRRQNNPILTGEAGVGKTAVVEGLALRIAAGDVPPPLIDVRLLSLDLALLQAGASMKGEFEERLKSVIEEVKTSPEPIVVFIDEAHTMIGAGGTAGQGDAANLLKPALARGEMRTVAATTWSEYKEFFEKDAALARRFQVVKVEEPDEEKAAQMLRGLVPTMESHHKIRVLDEAIFEAVRLSARYLPGRQLPDKAVSVLDTAGARVYLAQTATPAPIEDAARRIEAIESELRSLVREAALGRDHSDRTRQLTTELLDVRGSLESSTQRWKEESRLVRSILTLRDELEGAAHQTEDSAETRGKREELKSILDELDRVQAGSPLVPFCVNAQTVAEVISAWTGIPLGKMLRDEIATVSRLHELLGERIIGQQHALEEIAKRIRIARANLDDPGKPKGVFLLVGTSGVGKTETALALADILYGGERNIVTINMSEYQEAHSVSTLKGSPPGYVGYGKGGVLTEAVRRRPHSVVLLDEVEKAHPDVRELFFQVFDKGTMEDAEGREIDFKNTIIVLTSNVGTEEIMGACQQLDPPPTVEQLVGLVRPLLNKAFKPAFIGRLTVIPFYPIVGDVLKRIVRLKLEKIQRRVLQNHGASLNLDEGVVDAIAARCTESDSGARLIDNILSGTLLPKVSDDVLGKMARGERFNRIDVRMADNGTFSCEVT